MDVVLERHGDAEQRASDLSTSTLGVQRIRFRDGVLVDRDRGVQPLLVKSDARQVFDHELSS